MSKFAAWLIAHRKKKNLNQDELAARLKMNSRSISRYETGEGVPHKNNVTKFAEFFGVDEESLALAIRNDSEFPNAMEASEMGDFIPGFWAVEEIRAFSDSAGIEAREWLSRLPAWLDRLPAEFRKFIIESVAQTQPSRSPRANGDRSFSDKSAPLESSQKQLPGDRQPPVVYGHDETDSRDARATQPKAKA